MLKKVLKRGAVLAILAWGMFCLSVYFFPRFFFYHPSLKKASLDNAHANHFPAQEVTYLNADGIELYAWYVAPKNKGKVIVYLHGNSKNIEAFYHKLVPLAEAGYGVLMPEYRGFGGIRGEINQENLEKDALAALSYLREKGWKNKDIILYGMSLGSYTATYTAYQDGRNESFAALVLEVPFDSLFNVVRQRIWPLFPLKWLIRDRYDNLQMISQITSPILIMAGSKDTTVPIERARALFAAAQNPKELIVYTGAEHSSLYNHRNWRDLLEWLQKQ